MLYTFARLVLLLYNDLNDFLWILKEVDCVKRYKLIVLQLHKLILAIHNFTVIVFEWLGRGKAGW